MLHPSKPQLRIGRCFIESFQAYASHFPVLVAGIFLANVVGVLSLTLLLGSLYAGYFVMLISALDGDDLELRQLFCRTRRFIRFLFIPWFMFLGLILGVILPGIAIALASVDLKGEIGENADFVHIVESVRSILGLDLVTGAFGTDSIRWAVLVPAVILIATTLVAALLFAIRSFYVICLAGHRDLPLLDAYVESRNAVRRYGLFRHLVIILMALGLLSIFDLIVGDSPFAGIAKLVVLPVSLGAFASAYRQTLGMEARNREWYEHHYQEMRTELQTAHDMQMALLPEAGPDIRGFRAAGTCMTANSVGGDYFTYRWLDTDRTRLAIIVADVSGKAMEAAVTALRFSEILRYELRERTDPVEILAGMDASLQGQIEEATFVTCCIAVLHVPTGEVRIASAGHCPPYVYRDAGESVEQIDLTGFPLGMPEPIRPPAPYQTTDIMLAPGDLLCLYSDGVVEARNVLDEFYDEERLERGVVSLGKATHLEDAVASVVKRVLTFTGDAPRTDDITLVALKRDPAPPFA